MPKFPFTNYHELNLDWILKKVNALFDASEENARTIRTYDSRLTSAEQTATSAATAATSAQQLADAAAATSGNALSVAGTADQKADSALTAATNAAGTVAGALTTAQEAQQTAAAAVATANDAAATASSLESLANTANQNATAALETAQTADQKAVAAQTAATTADQKAVAAQTAATTNAGNISTLQTDVSNLNRQISDVEENQLPELKSALYNTVIYQGETGSYNKTATITPESVYDWECYIPDKTLITFTNNSSAAMTLSVFDKDGNGQLITNTVSANGGTNTFEAPFEIHAIRNYVGNTSSFDVSITYRSTLMARQSLENEGYIIKSTGLQPLYINKGEQINIDVKSNTAATNLMISPYAGGDTYLTMYSGANKYKFTAPKSGYISLNNSGTTINAVVTLEKVSTYTVKKAGGGDFRSFVDCLKFLKGDEREKIIYVYNGVYDIYKENGGDAFIKSITDPAHTSWADVNAIVPPNTTIIGMGQVTLQYTPTATQIGSNAMALLFSPLNICGNCTIENIAIEATNCRYAIHDESGGNSKYNDDVHIYRNVRAHKIKGTYGQNATFASGIGARNRWYFEDCVFTNDIGICWTVHTNNSIATDMALIDFKNCIFAKDNGTSQTGMVAFISGGHSVTKNNVFMSGCYVGGEIFLSAGGQSGLTQKYDLTLVGNKVVSGITVDPTFNSNPYTPKVYMPIA